MKDENNLAVKKRITSEWDERIFFILAIMLILIPIIFYPYCIPIFQPIKQLAFQLLSLLALVLFLLKFIESEKIAWYKTGLDIPVLFYLVFGSLSLIWSANIYHSITALPLFLAGPILYYIISQSIKEQKFIDRLILIIIFAGTLMGAYGMFQYFGIDLEFWTGNVGRGQVFGLFGNVNYFAEFMILPLSMTIGLAISYQKKFNRFLLIIAVIIMGTALFLTFTRGSYLAIALTIPLLLLVFLRSTTEKPEKKYYKKLLLIFLLLVFIGLSLIYIPHPFNQRGTPLGQLRTRTTISSLTSGRSIMRRVAIWKFTWMMIENNLLLGSGLGTYDYLSLKYQAEFFARNNNRGKYPHGFAVQAHNEYLQMWAELGIIGLLFFLGILFFYYRNVLYYIHKTNDNQKALIISLSGGVTAILIDAIFGFPLQLTASLSLFWITISLTFAQIYILKTGQEEITKTTVEKEIDNYVTSRPLSFGLITLKIILAFMVIAGMIVLSLFLIRPFMARVHWYYGNQQIVKGNHNEAIKIYEEGLKWNSWQGEMYYDIGIVLSNRGLNTPAIEYYKKAEKYVDHHYLPQNIANSFLKKGQLKEAIPYLEKAIKYQPSKKKMLPLQLQLGNIYLTIKNFKNAERHFADAIHDNPNNEEAYYGLAGAYLNQGKKEQGIEALQKVIELEPESKLAGYAKTTLTKIKLEEE
jgi:O-antigen ligase/Tfp pilus assembly protein PilF